MSADVTTLPIAEQTFWTVVAVVAGLLLTAIVYWLLTQIGKDSRPPIWERIDEGMKGPVIIFGFLILTLFLGAILAAGFVILHTIQLVLRGETTGINLGSGTLIAALLGAPFLIWGTWLKYQTVRYQKEGHITDRINKAVEMLGAEKTVERIGRPVTIWTGKPERINYNVEDASKLAEHPRTRLSKMEWSQVWDHEKDEPEVGFRQTVSIWPAERTVIQWQNEIVELSQDEEIGVEGNWQVFKETVPNLEVRVGAILSLERIAQDSTLHDNGRDHLRVMEILCSYVRENARAKNLEPTPTPFQSAKPRIDVQTVVNTIGRRSEPQKMIEADARFRLDLKYVNFDGVSFIGGDFSGAMFWNSRFEGADFHKTNLSGTQFFNALLDFANFKSAIMYGTLLNRSILNRANFGSLNLAKINGVCIEGAQVNALDFSTDKSDDFFGSKDTVVSDEYKEAKESALRLANTIFLDSVLKREGRQTLSEITDEQRVFLHWNPYNMDDLASGKFWQPYRDRKGLNGWPFDSS